MDATWYVFEAYNTETRFGCTDKTEVAMAALENLNKDREINFYSWRYANRSEIEEFENRNDAMFTMDTDLVDLEEEQ